MPTIEDAQLHPWGWENDPEEERWKLSTLDYLSTTTWVNKAIFFSLEDSKKPFVPTTHDHTTVRLEHRSLTSY